MEKDGLLVIKRNRSGIEIIFGYHTLAQSASQPSRALGHVIHAIPVPRTPAASVG